MKINIPKILFVVNGYPTEEHPEYCVFTKEQIESVLKTGEVEGDVHFINSRDKGVLEYVRSFFKLRRLIKDYDIIHCFHGLTLILVFLISPNKKILISFLNKIENEFSQDFLSKILIKLVRFITKRKNIIKIFKDRIPSDRKTNSYYLPNGVDLNTFYSIDKSVAKKYLGLDETNRYVLFVSSKNLYRKQKRYDRFCEIMNILKTQYKYENLKELCLVNTSRDEIKYYYNASDLHLLCSDYEGSPNSVKESLACNIPIVCTSVGNVKDMLNKVEGSYVSDSFDVQELALEVNKILEHNGYNDFRQDIINKRLDIDSIADKLISIYKKMYNER